jgi:glycosyltransferase involved in cell wall biosynthesis
MSRPTVAIAHDYLTQRGGAERVVLTLRKAFPDAPIYTTLYDPDGTYPEFRDAQIITSPLNRVGVLRSDHRRALPLLAPASSRLRVDADVTIVSSSGWAHGFDIRGRSAVYCYSPARWLYDSDRYLGRPAVSSPLGLALLAMRPALTRWDSRAASRADRYLAISEVVRERIRATYGIDAEVVPAPHSMDREAEQQLIPDLGDWTDGYLLLVSRLLPYKNVDLAIEAARESGRRMIVIGRGPEEQRLRATLPSNVRMFSGLSDSQMRWAYAHARLLVAPSHEDFGLTPLEAATFGVPSVALRGGGYLDTIVDGETGLFFDVPRPEALNAVLDVADRHPWDPVVLRRRADLFGETRFVDTIRAVAADLGEGVE